MNSKSFVLAVIWLHVLLFGYAAITKLSDHENFRFGLTESPFFAQFAGVLSWGVPVVELLIAALLIIPFTKLAGLYAAFALMLAFTIYIGAMLLFAREIPCSCGGVLEEMSWSAHLAFNAAFVVLSALAINILRRKRAGNGPLQFTFNRSLSIKP